MRAILAAALLATVFNVTPAAAQTQTPGIGQALQGLLGGGQSQDQALRDAYERGYQRGRDDEARRGRDDGERRSERRSTRERDDEQRDDRRR